MRQVLCCPISMFANMTKRRVSTVVVTRSTVSCTWMDETCASREHSKHDNPPNFRCSLCSRDSRFHCILLGRIAGQTTHLTIFDGRLASL